MSTPNKVVGWWQQEEGKVAPAVEKVGSLGVKHAGAAVAKET
jgi:hypothetical protein